ncbi:MAG: acetylxylan esterase [Chthoniobacterales bacterium]|nr:acetylxylan esterase [Chthoniobacterales bacterium]
MPALDKPLSELRTYLGINPKPADFDEYWARALAELDSIAPDPELIPCDALGARGVETFDLYFQSVGGARIYAKYLRPRQPAKPGPGLLLFHGYSGQSGDWQDKLSFVGQGMAVAALDCRGQGGRSQDPGGVRGNTFRGHIIRGLDESPDKLLFRQIFLDTVQLARVVSGFSEVNELFCMGGSQGGGLSIACAALEPRIRRCVSIFPFLSDYRRVWEMDLAKDAYLELRDYLRWFDPLHEREEEIFRTLGYIDVHHLAPRIQARVLMALTLMDTICPPSSQFAVFNNLSTEKESVIYPDFGHESLPGFPDRAFRFLTAE